MYSKQVWTCPKNSPCSYLYPALHLKRINDYQSSSFVNFIHAPYHMTNCQLLKTLCRFFAALPKWLRWLPTGADAVYDEVTARFKTTLEKLPCSQAPPRSHQRSTPSLSPTLGTGARLSAASFTTGATRTPADVWCQHGQYLRLCLLPGESSGRGWGRLQQPVWVQTEHGLSQQSQESGVWFRLLRGLVAGWWSISEEDQECAGVIFSLHAHTKITKRTYSPQIHLRRLSGDMDIIWGQWPRGLDKLFIDQRAQPPTSGFRWQQLCRSHTELDGLARMSRAYQPEANFKA